MELRRKIAAIIIAVTATVLLATAIEYGLIAVSTSTAVATDGTIINQN